MRLSASITTIENNLLIVSFNVLLLKAFPIYALHTIFTFDYVRIIHNHLKSMSHLKQQR
jgi:hypothetical protein